MEQGIVYIFLTECNYGAPYVELFPKARQDEVAATKNQKLRCEKQGVWQLLTLALEKLGSSIDEIAPYKTENGKWCSDELYFSLSHSNSLLGVAISSEPVGIDIENVDDFTNRYSELSHLKGFLNRIRASAEDDTPTADNLISLWTAKESIYKMCGEGMFLPALINSAEYSVTHIEWQSREQNYCISLCTKQALTNSEKDIVVKYIEKI